MSLKECPYVQHFNQLYADSCEQILALITAKCGNPMDVQDIFQETYAEVFTIIRKKGINYITNPNAFISNIAKQKIYRYYRFRDRAHALFRFRANDEEPELPEWEMLELDSFEIEDELDRQNLIQQIKQYIHTQPMEVQKIFYLCYQLNKTIPEIAELMEMSVSGVKNKIYRTIKSMRVQISKEGER